MRKTVVIIGALAAGVTILDWLERSAWVRLLPAAAVVVFPLVFNLLVLAVIVIGVVKIAGLEGHHQADHTANDAAHRELKARVGRLEEWKMQGGGDTLEALAHRALKSIDPKTGGMDVKRPQP